MGVLLVRGHMQTKADKLTPRAKNWVSAMRAQFQSLSIGTDVHPTLNDEDILSKIF